MNKYNFSYLGAKRKRRSRGGGNGLWRKLFLFCFVLFVVGFVSVGAIIMFMFKVASDGMPDPNQLTNRASIQSTKIYDRTGENLLYEIHGEEKRTLVKIEDIPESVILATIGAEDRGFYDHQGINLRGLFRAIYNDIVYRKKEGGSSITQQLITNTLLSRGTTNWQKLQRKFREWILAYKIEKKLSKEEILQKYLNEIPYGSNAYGVQSASKTFFDKDIKDITLAESAILASLPNKPTRFSPYGNHKEKLIERQQWILRYMRDQKKITEEEYQEAIGQELIFSSKKNLINAPHFVMYVREYLSQKYGEKTLEQGGLKIITTLDFEKQKIAEKILQEKSEDYMEDYNASNAALLALDTKTGQILTMIGSRDYYDDEIDGQVNVTIRSRQPGSSFKPLVYATAFQRGYTPDTILFDVNTTFKAYPKDYTPKNYKLDENGPVTIRKALAGSLNIPAVKAIYLAGIDKVLNFADNLGYSTLKDRSRFGMSLVLGGGEVKMLEHLNAFSTFAREGAWKPTTSILKIENAEGVVLEEFKLQTKQKFNKEIGRLINDILSDNDARAYAFGPNNYLTLGNRPVAAKTGTTNDYRDAWTLGYTPSLAVAVWVGNNDFTEMKKRAAGGSVAAPIWKEAMKQLLGDSPIEYFKKPKEIEVSKPVLAGEYKIPFLAKIDKLSGKLATENTPAEYVEEKIFYEFHNILHYLDKDDPLGSENSQTDEQYENWESSVQAWIKAEQEKIIEDGEENIYIVETPPEDVDETHVLENQPTINFTFPENNSTVVSRDFKAEVGYITPAGEIKKIRYYIDDKLIKIVTQAPFTSLEYEFNEIVNGFHFLKAEIYDDKGNFNATQININLLLPAQPILVQWLGPPNNSSFNLANMPISISINISDYTQVQKVEFYSGERLITTVNNFESGRVAVDWQEKEMGLYNLHAKIYDKSGQEHPVAVENIKIK